jgi:hypothetical protein
LSQVVVPAGVLPPEPPVGGGAGGGFVKVVEHSASQASTFTQRMNWSA